MPPPKPPRPPKPPKAPRLAPASAPAPAPAVAPAEAVAGARDTRSFAYQTSRPGDRVAPLRPKPYGTGLQRAHVVAQRNRPGDPAYVPGSGGLNGQDAVAELNRLFATEIGSQTRRARPGSIESAAWHGPLFAVSLEGPQRMPVVLQLVGSPRDGTPELMLYVRLPRKTAQQHNLPSERNAIEDGKVPHFCLGNGAARRILANLKVSRFGDDAPASPPTTHHPYVLSILVSLYARGGEGRVDWNPTSLAQGFDEFAGGQLTVVCLPPLHADLEKCLILLGHSKAVDWVTVDDPDSGRDSEPADAAADAADDAASAASDELPCAHRLDRAWAVAHRLSAQSADIGNQFRTGEAELLKLTRKASMREVTLFTDAIPQLTRGMSLDAVTDHLEPAMKQFVAAPSRSTPDRRPALPNAVNAAKKAKTTKTAAEPRPVKAPPVKAIRSKPATDDGGDDESEEWDMSEQPPAEASAPAPPPPPVAGARPRLQKRPRSSSDDEDDLDADDESDPAEDDSSSEERDDEDEDEDEDEDDDEDERVLPVVPAPLPRRAAPPVAPVASTAPPPAPAAPSADADLTYLRAQLRTTAIPALQRLLAPAVRDRLGFLAGPLNENMTNLMRTDSGHEAPHVATTLIDTVVNMGHAFALLAEQRDADDRVRMPATEAVRIRELAQQAHATTKGTLPQICAALRQAQALEASLLELKNRGSEVLAGIAQGGPAAAAAAAAPASAAEPEPAPAL